MEEELPGKKEGDIPADEIQPEPVDFSPEPALEAPQNSAPYEECARLMNEIQNQILMITSAQDKNDQDMIQIHRDFAAFMRIQDNMQAELEQHRSGLFRQLLDPVLSAISRIYADYANNLERLEDQKLRKNFGNMFGDIEQLLTENGVESYLSVIGGQVSKRYSRIRGKVPTADKELHGTVVKSYNTGFHIGPRVLVPEAVDVYFFDSTITKEE
ncbi:nucleotide exchange factor GrpE [Leadbettera azotonutricia]|uniref:GrpE protein n=1 Tax=Leadbettera azotonutricia (strain ATCC BAA-888 / DSM 13862 / ZAS-9) TaxID=545695 RepID=F5Y7K3_LEAAZ|nr:nucleotide exchange factor GrpE [Leadbettera azotonutricia]AEF81314.1 hypothetical protein TREAZ_1075 [Leadbettera azotonutricia ZAS-9]